MKVGLTASAFDLLHAGHISMLREASSVCDYLICAIQIDPSQHREQKNKPVQSIVERYMQIRAVSYVDEVIPYQTEDELVEIILAYPVDVRILGEEYRGNKFLGHDIKMQFHFNGRRHGFSTSELRCRMQKNAPKSKGAL